MFCQQLDTQNSCNSNTSNADINNVSMELSAESSTSKRSRTNDVSTEVSMKSPLSKRPRRLSDS